MSLESDDYGKSCVLATHIGPGWNAPDKFNENVEDYLANTDYESLIYISDPGYDSGQFVDMADKVIESRGGHLDSVEVEGLLDQYTRFHHIGAYWGSCHQNTWNSMMSGVHEEGRDSLYQFIFPTNCITGTENTLKDDPYSLYGEPTTIPEKLDEILNPPSWEEKSCVENIIDEYIETAEEGAREDLSFGEHYSAGLVCDTPIITWVFGESQVSPKEISQTVPSEAVSETDRGITAQLKSFIP
jgi:hypothetical protein